MHNPGLRWLGLGIRGFELGICLNRGLLGNCGLALIFWGVGVGEVGWFMGKLIRMSFVMSLGDSIIYVDLWC
jgi:hypothetical protein